MSDRRQQNERRLAADRRRRGRRRKLDGRVFVIELTSVDWRVAQLERSTQQGADRGNGWATRWRRDAASLDS
ncbi:MAG TPA: hypothetical protein PKC18_19390, partial [Lacipirellulaceae bacterium]|nr:hypothetical protein [Lacipirellulaceae bacterium]